MIGLFGKKKIDAIEHIAGIVLRQDSGVGYVIRVNHDAKKVSILDERRFSYSSSWDGLVYDIDELLYYFEGAHDIKVSRTLFFTYSHLVDLARGELKASYMQSVQAIVKENKLESLGYVEFDELLARVYKERDHTHLNAVIVEVDSSAVTVSVYQGGKRIFAESVAKTQDIVADLQEVFSHVDPHIRLPARMILYGEADCSAASHTLSIHKWKEDMFIQIPRVELVGEDQMKQAVEIGVRDTILGEGGTVDIPVTNEPDHESSRFVASDIHEAESEQEELSEGPQASGQLMGFAIGEDVLAQAAQPKGQSYEEDRSDAYMEPAVDSAIPQSSASLHSPRPLTLQVGAIMKRFQSIPMFLKGRGIHILIAVVCLCLIAAALIAGAYFTHKAEVIAYYDAEVIKKDIAFTDSVAAEPIKKTISVTAEVEATGKKNIGEAARGEVTLFNADDKERILKKGTILSTADGLQFVLDADVTSKAATKTITDTGDILTSTSKVQAAATAKEIGVAHNIKKDAKLSIEGLPDTTVFARVATAFTGGTQKEVKTASKEDFAKLDAAVKKSIDAKGKEEMKAMGEGKRVIEPLTSVEVTKSTYSKEIAEQADSIEANVTADVIMVTFNDQKLKEEVIRKLTSDVQEGFTLDPEDIEVTISSAERDEDDEEKITFEVAVEARPTPEVDVQALVQVLKGRANGSIEKAELQKYRLVSVEADISSILPFLGNRYPFFTRNISLTLERVEQ